MYQNIILQVDTMSQSAFVKDRYIQDNFRFVQGSARLLHASKESYLLLKVDI
jgi:hypothetical protein